MWRKRVITLAMGILCLTALSATIAEVLASPDAPTESYAIPWWTVDSGGGVSQGGPYTLSGTAGQPDAGNLAGGIYALKGGFWGGLVDYVLYLPQLVR